jgi:glucose-6-phosphate 1-dehydrogenase
MTVLERNPLERNPLAVALERPPAQATALTIFGATGDLARRKLLPALYNLAHEGSLPERFAVVGVARGELTDSGFRAFAQGAIRRFSRRVPDEDVLDALLAGMRFVEGSFDAPQTYAALQQALSAFDAEAGEPLNRVFYLSTAPLYFPVIVEQLGAHGLDRREHGAVRVVIEKPFGTTLAEARELNRRVLAVFDESQIYRIDHYLGKETVQNMLAFRFANSLFEPAWNRNTIRSVQITAAEDIGIGDRAGFYDRAGALRDLVQNHLLQLLCQVAMEPPVDFGADEVRNEKVKVLRAIRPPSEAEVRRIAVRAQYGPGVVGGEPVPAYLEEPGVPPASRTETFVALRLEIESWRWAGVPFYLRTGKRLARKVTEIAVELKPVPHRGFAQDGSIGVQPNLVILTIQPDEGVTISLAAKIPGTLMRIRPVLMQFLYGSSFLSESPEAYERLILDVMRGDPTLFTRADEVEAQWRICDPILQAWEREPGLLPTYPAGSQGPEDADRILCPGDRWRRI